MTGGAWEDTDKTHRPRKSTTNSLCVPSRADDQLTQDETNFYTAVDLADLQMKLRRWTFAQNWKTASSSSSSPPADEETNLSPLSRPIHLDDKSPTYSSKKDGRPPLSASSQTDTTDNKPALAHRLQQQTATTPPLDEDLMAQYLNRCIAAAETQLAGARDKSKVKNGAVKEIERLVEKVVRQAELGE